MATTLDELLVRLDLDSAKFREGIGEATDKLTELNEHVEHMGTTISEGVTEAIGSWEILKGGIEKVVDFVKESVTAFAEQERATFQLNSAMKQMGYNAEELEAPLENQRKHFEETTLATEKQLTKMQQLMLQYHIAPKDIEQVTAAILDYSAANGKDAVESTEQVVKALNEHSDGITRLNVHYKSLNDVGKDVNQMLGQLSGNLKGAAEAEAGGMSGTLDKMKKSWEHLQEAVGGLFALIESKLHIFGIITDAVNGWRYLLGGGTAEEKQGARYEELNKLLRERNSLMEKDHEWGTKAAGDLIIVNQKIKELQAAIAEADKKSGTKTDVPATPYVDHAKDKKKEKEDPNEKAWAKLLEDVDKEIEKNLTPFEKFQKELQTLKALMDSGAMDATDYAKAVDRVTDAYDKSANKFLDDVQKKLDSYSNNYGGALADRVGNPEMDPMTGQTIGYHDATAVANPFNPSALDKSVADLMKKVNDGIALGNQWIDQVRAASVQTMGFIERTAMGFMTRALGNLGQVINAAVDGFKQGGVMGAVVAALAQILSMAQGFSQMVSVANGVLGDLIKAISVGTRPLFQAISSMLAGFGEIMKAVGSFLAPILKAIAPIFKDLGTIFWQIGVLLQGLQPILEFVGKVIGFFMDELNVVFWAIFQIIKVAGAAILGTVLGLEYAWNGIVEAIASVFKAIDWVLSKIPFVGHPLQGLINSIESWKANTDSTSDALNKLWNASYNGTKATDDATASTLGFTDAITQATGALLNVPTIFKIAATRYGAETPGGLSFASAFGNQYPFAGKFASGGVVSSASLALVGEGGGRELIAPEDMLRNVIRQEAGGGRGATFNFYVTATNGRELYNQFKQYLQRDQFTRTGYTMG